MPQQPLQQTSLTCPPVANFTGINPGLNDACAYHGAGLYPIADCCVGYDNPPVISLFQNCTYFCATTLVSPDFQRCVAKYGEVERVVCYQGVKNAVSTVSTAERKVIRWGLLWAAMIMVGLLSGL